MNHDGRGVRTPFFCTAAILFISMSAAAGPPYPETGIASDRFQPLDIFRLRSASEIRLSPDGKSAAYVVSFRDIETDRVYSNIHLATADGTAQEAVTTGKYLDRSPRWSPDGRRLIFLSNRAGSSQLHELTLSDRSLHTLTTLELEPLQIEPSPDGRRIAFTALARGPKPVLADLPTPPPGARWADPMRIIEGPVFRSAGPDFVDPGYVHIFTVDADGGNLRQVTSGNDNYGPHPVYGASPFAWMPDGRSVILAMHCEWDPEFQIWSENSEVYRIDIETGQSTQLTTHPGRDDRPVPSPDGKRIVFLRQLGDPNATVAMHAVHVMDADGGNVLPIGADVDRISYAPAWASDGRSVYFAYNDRAVAKIGELSLDGELQEIVEGNLLGQEFSVGPNGQVAYIAADSRLHEEAAVRLPQGDVHLVSNLNHSWLQGNKRASLENLVYPSGHPDGRSIQAWMLKPPEFRARERYPVIVDLHGGPYSASMRSFDVDQQLFAAAGYIVIAPNYRGSRGFGIDFSQLSDRKHYPGWFDHEHAAHEMGLDVTGLLTILEELEIVDPKHVYLRGISAGALLTTWVLGRSDGFRAAAAQSWYSGEWNGAFYGAYQVRRYFNGPPWNLNHTLEYSRRSPIMLAGRINTPLMLLHGSGDYVTPLTEVEKYYYLLRGRGLETVMVIFPDETHAIRDRPSNWMNSLIQELAWFGRHRTDQVSPE